MAAQGRNNDSMLVHMTPKEVSGLHALAAANGGQLTINPETGLPEAGLLEDLLPAIIGFGLNTFVPGLGEVVGGAFGLGAAAGTGIAVGGLTALATGNLSKGVMAGFGAYGGAGLGESLMGAGADAATKTAAAQLQGANETAAASLGEYANPRDVMMARTAPEIASASPMDKLTAGFSATTKSPEALMNFAKGSGKYFLAAGAPALLNAFSEEDETVTKMPSTGMITPFVMNRKQLARDDSLSPSAQQRYLSYGVTPVTPVRAAEGGAVSVRQDAYGRTEGDPNFGKPSDQYEGITIQGGEDEYGNLNGSAAARRAMLKRPPPADNTDPYTRSLLGAAAPRPYRNTMTGDSKAAYDYLMGNRDTAPGLPIKPKPPRLPGVGLPGAPALSTAGISALAAQFAGPSGTRGGGERSESKYVPVSPLASPEEGSLGFRFLDAYGNIPILPLSSLAKLKSQDMLTGELKQAGINAAAAKEKAIAGYAEGTMFGAPPSDPRTFGGGGYGTVPGFVTSMTGAGIPANPMSVDPAQAQQAMANQVGGASLRPRIFDVNPLAPADVASEVESETELGDPNAETVQAQFERAQKENQDRLNSYIRITAEQEAATAAAEAADAKQQAADARQAEINRIDAAYNQMAATTFEGSGSRGGSSTGPAAGATNASHGGEGGGWGSRDAGAQGGFLNNGKFDQRYAHGGGITALAQGGYNLGSYSDGGRLLRGPGDGVSDSIPAVIGKKQPARLADGEFVVPARIVSELGNGSTQAGARQLYAMMDRIQAGRKKTVGKGKVAKNTRSAKYLPA